MLKNTSAKVAAAALSFWAASSSAQAAFGFALTSDGQLIPFDVVDDQVQEGAASPLSNFRAVDSRLIGIDFRVQDGRLYGVGDGGGVYRLRRDGSMVRQGRLSTPLEGTEFGLDFNPAADRLRIVSDTGQNLRHHVADPAFVTLVDGALNDGALPPVAVTGVSGAAYTNNDLNAVTGTTLFVLALGGVTDTVRIQAPPNNGSLSATGTLSVDASTVAGFDILSQVDGLTGETINTGYAALKTGDSVGLYRVNVLDGKLTQIGTFASDVVDIAIVP